MAYKNSTDNYLSSYSPHFVNNGYNLRQQTTNAIPLKICKMKRSSNLYTRIDISPLDTLAQLKERIAYYLRLELPVTKFFLEMFNETDHDWKIIDDLNSSITINQLKLRPGDVLNAEYYNQKIANEQRTLSSNVTSTTNDELTLKLCKKSLEKSEYTYIMMSSSSSTIGDLRKRAYEELNKPANNQPIYLLKGDSWTKYESDKDNTILCDLSLQSNTFISIEPEEEINDSKIQVGLCGLLNLGSTCFMNSIFQCLSNMPNFTEKILAVTNEINTPIIDEYKNLVKKMWSGKYKYLDPSILLDHINDNLPRYASYRQQDAQEFMNDFLHLIHGEFSMKKTLITDLFYGEIQSNVRCLECHHIESTNELISFLPLPISNYNQRTVLYVKADGEQRLISVLIDESVRAVGDLIDYFLQQHESILTRDRIRPFEVMNNRMICEYETWESLSRIPEETLAFLECPERSAHQRYILCKFLDQSTGRAFRPPLVLVCPLPQCFYINLSEQIDQLLGHLCSITNASSSACQLYWLDRHGKQHQLAQNDEISDIAGLVVEMADEWTDIYKVYNNINYTSENSALSRLLSNFFREEALVGDYHCLKCGKRTKARQKSSINHPLPHVLIIQLKRFSYDMYTKDKIDTYISFPLYGLDLNEHLVKTDSDKPGNKSSTKYDLVAVSNHSGDLTAGHYITYAKNFQDGNWYSFDDKFVKRLQTDRDIVTKDAYILIYVKTT